MENKISYLNRTYSDYKEALIDYSKKYYPDLSSSFNDSSVGSWIIDLNAEIADNLSYHIDRVFQETNINSAQEFSSINAIARNYGYKIPGPKGAMAEVKFTCHLPMKNGSANGGPDWNYAPIIRRGTKVSSNSQNFELLYDVDFAEQFDINSKPDRTQTLITVNGVKMYKITKLAIVVAGETKIYRKEIYNSDIKPFMEVILPDKDVMNVESIVFKDGGFMQDYPSYSEFYMPNETSSTYKTTKRFFEVENLAQQHRWGESCEGDEPIVFEYSYKENGKEYPVYSITKGEWKPMKRKFMTEYTDGGYLKVIFGAGHDYSKSDDGSSFAQYQISKIIKNDSLGILPSTGTTMFVMYRVGGGVTSNVAKGAINRFSLLKTEIPCSTSLNSSIQESVKLSITVESTTPSVSGRDMPTTNELKYLIKYNSSAQERCVTVKDYIDRIMKLPPKYGTPFRVGVMEANNKIMIFVLGVDHLGNLDASLPYALALNIQNYLTEYRMINDFVEIKSGRIVNLSFDVDVFVDKNYNTEDVRNSVKNVINDYMNVNKHNMGESIFCGDIIKEISKTDGVINVSSFRVYNELSTSYSQSQINQEIVTASNCEARDYDGISNGSRLRVDLDASDNVLYSDGDTMLEIKYPEKNITVNIKTA